MSIIPRMYDFERPFRMLERDFDSDLLTPSPFNQLVPREFFAPEFFKPWEIFRRLERFIRPMEQQMSQVMNQMNQMNQMVLTEASKVHSDDEKFQVIVDVQHFAPEEINVKVIDRHVVVEGKHEEKRDQHGYVSRQFIRRYALPEGCLPDTVESKLSSDGVLTITAPRVLPLPSIGEKIIPIQKTGPVKKQLGSPDPVKEAIEESK